MFYHRSVLYDNSVFAHRSFKEKQKKKQFQSGEVWEKGSGQALEDLDGTLKVQLWSVGQGRWIVASLLFIFNCIHALCCSLYILISIRNDWCENKVESNLISCQAVNRILMKERREDNVATQGCHFETTRISF